MVGREDWDRGFRVLFRSFDCLCDIRFDESGGLHLLDFPSGELVLSADEFQRGLSDGWEYRSVGLEVDISAGDLRALLRQKLGCCRLQLVASR